MLYEAIFNAMWRHTWVRPRGRAPNRVRSVGPSSARFLAVVAGERGGGGVRLVVVHLVVVPAVGRAARVVVVVGRGTTVVQFEARSATFGRGAGRRARTREGARGGRRREVDA